MLRTITQENRTAVEALRVAPEQEQFVAGVADSRRHRVPRAVLSLAPPHRYALPGAGTGSGTLDAVVSHVRDRPVAEALYTSAGIGEGSPRGFYESYGFGRTGATLQDEVVLRYLIR